MQTEEITFEKNGLKAKITISEANTLMGIRRSRMQSIARNDAQIKMSNGEIVDQDEWISQCVYYPDCIAGAIKIEINGKTDPPTLEEFNALPDAFTVPWGDTVYKLNPHWLPQGSDEEKKKEPQTT